MAKNSEGIIHDRYNPTDNLQATHEVITFPPPDHPLKLQSSSVRNSQQYPQAKKERQYFIDPITQPESRGTSGHGSHSTLSPLTRATRPVIKLHTVSSLSHQPHPPQRPSRHSQNKLSSTISASTQDGHTANPQQPPRISSAAIHRFSHTTVTVMESSRYPYTADLLSLDECHPVISLHALPVECCHITTPLNVQQWLQLLVHHPDKQLCKYIISGITQGFRIGFNRNATQLQSAQANMTSAHLNPDPVDSYLTEEITAGRIVPVPKLTHPSPPVHISRFGVIPKRNKPGKWRLILDLSAPPGMSINDGISTEACSLHYSSVDDAARIILASGPQTWLAKLDVERAYRNVPIHTQDRHLLGMEWRGTLLVDTVLPFGLRAAPKIFCALSDTVEWIAMSQGMSAGIHYIDDFLTFGSSEAECARNLEILSHVCIRLGFPLAQDKMEGPSQKLCFLGIELDCRNLEMRLPADKLRDLRQEVENWQPRKAATKRQLLSLIGRLAHATKVVIPGRIFLRRMIDLSTKAKQLHHWVHLNQEFRSDPLWWKLFLTKWNGTSMLRVHGPGPQDEICSTDASGKWGCAAVWRSKWLWAPWPPSWAERNIADKELVPIVLAVAIWGQEWAHRNVLVRCDNEAVVHVIRLHTSRDSGLMHLLRCMHFFSAQFDINVSVEHVRGRLNTAADALSRNSLQAFFRAVPSATRTPTPIPAALWEMVVTVQPDWTSPGWRSRLWPLCGKGWPHRL